MELQPGQIYFDLGGIPFGQVDEFGVDWAIDADGFDGWGATGSTRESVQKARAGGAWSGQGYARPRNISARGRFFAPTPEAARAALDRLNEAVSIDDTDLMMHEPGMSRRVVVHRTDDVLHKWIMPESAEWAFGMVADDYRKFSTPLSASTRLPASSGGLTVPFTVPFTVDATLVSGQVNLTNTGNETGPVILRVDGPCHGPSITHVASGLTLVFSASLVLGVGEWLTIDTEAKTVMANDQSSRNGYITSRGWFGFVPNDNTFAFTATSFDADALLTVTATPAHK